MRKKITFKIYIILFALGLVVSNNNVFSQSYPSILIDGDEVLVSDISKFPYWLHSGQTLNLGVNVYSISVLQYDIVPAVNGGNNLLFDSIISVKTLKTVPLNKGWKIESVGLNVTLASIGGGGDNWGSQVAVTSPRLQGQGTGASPLDIAQQSATSEQILRWDGSSWSPDITVYTDATLTGNGSSATPLGIAQQGAQVTEVLTWTGTQWAPAVSSGVPAGVITMWSGSIANIPIGWALCDGTNGTPDLRNRFIVGAGSTYAVAEIGGEATHVLTVTEMPSHSHSMQTVDSNGGTGKIEGSANTSNLGYVNTESTGGGQPHENRPPYYALAYIMKL